MGAITVDMRELQLVLKRTSQRSKNLPMKLYATQFLSEVDDVIQSEGAAGTKGKWEPFADSTLERHPRRVGGSLLQDTGALAAIQVKQITGTSFVLESNPHYAKYHLTGTEHMPERDFFAVNFQKALDDMGDEVLQELI